jgi:type II secretory ATPase GspE/PulE/Tfp pilus assembly ATPase PilB-like protein
MNATSIPTAPTNSNTAKMPEQQLARLLVSRGLLSPSQVQFAASRRTPARSFAQVLVDENLLSQIDILQCDPHAFDSEAPASAQSAPQFEAAAPGAAAVSESAPQAAAQAAEAAPEVQVGLGQDELGPVGEDVRIVGESRAEDDAIPNHVVHYCNSLLHFAVSLRASDLHLEPREDSLLPRYRVDGALRTFGVPIDKEFQLPILSRFKVLSGLDITENRMPQDGRFRAIIGGRTFDFRVSTMPGIHGEKMVMRLLDRTALVTDLTKLGFSDPERNLFEEMLGRSYGLILVTGPTGSGKTTTLYAALAATRDDTKNVITVEDPVEYEMPGVTQSGVNSEIGLTFATQLRAILRQDPDVILVGEIRDSETADIAVRAALTGHLVLSTLHTNSAAAAVARLQDMDVPDFLLASSISGILAQRLIRLICRHCRVAVDPSDPQYSIDITRLRLPEGSTLYRGAGCESCNHTGLRGRAALIELMNVDGAIRAAIARAASADEIRQLAVAGGMKSLWRDGQDKVLRGLTTAEEVARVLLGAEDVDMVLE